MVTILSVAEEEEWREKLFHYSLKDQLDPLGRYHKILEDIEESMDPSNKIDIDTLPAEQQDWLRST